MAAIGSNSLKLSEFTEAFVVATDHPLVNPSSSSRSSEVKPICWRCQSWSCRRRIWNLVDPGGVIYKMWVQPQKNIGLSLQVCGKEASWLYHGYIMAISWLYHLSSWWFRCCFQNTFLASRRGDPGRRASSLSGWWHNTWRPGPGKPCGNFLHSMCFLQYKNASNPLYLVDLLVPMNYSNKLHWLRDLVDDEWSIHIGIHMGIFHEWGIPKMDFWTPPYSIFPYDNWEDGGFGRGNKGLQVARIKLEQRPRKKLELRCVWKSIINQHKSA